MALTANQIFNEKIAQKLKDKPETAQKINAVYQFNLTGDTPSTWTLDLTAPGGKVSEGAAAAPKCTVTISEENLSKLVEKQLNPQMAFMTGKLKVAGDMGLALKLGAVL